MIWINDVFLVTGHLGTNFTENPTRFKQGNAFENVLCKMVTTVSRPQWVNWMPFFRFGLKCNYDTLLFHKLRVLFFTVARLKWLNSCWAKINKYSCTFEMWSFEWSCCINGYFTECNVLKNPALECDLNLHLALFQGARTSAFMAFALYAGIFCFSTRKVLLFLAHHHLQLKQLEYDSLL